MSRKLTHEEFLDKFNKQNKHAKDIEILGEYKTSKTKIKCKCKLDGHIWETTPNELLKGRGCPKCAGVIRKTHEEFLQELYKINTDIQVLGTYVNYRTKIKVRCKIDGHIWEAMPNDLLHGKGCFICTRRKLPQNNPMTHEEFMKKFYEKNKHAKDIEILGTYVNNRTKIKCRCKIDGYEWEVTPNSLLDQKSGCRKCAGKMKRTHAQFITELSQINTDIEVLGTYINLDTKIKVRCKLDGYEWEARPHDLLKGHGCLKCKVRKQRKTHEQFLQDLYKINENIQVLSTYKGIYTHIKCKCKLDGYEWETTPALLLQGHGCPKCAGVQRYTHEEFMQELYKRNIHAKDIEVLGTYVNIGTKIKCRCKLDGYEWEARPAGLLIGYGCPICNTSKGEKRIAQYLDNLGIAYIYDKRYFKDLVSVNGGLMRPDFLIPALKIWIEYDGEQHFRPVDFTSKMSKKEVQEKFEYTQQNDQIKNQYAKDNNWTLIRIPYYDYDNIEQILDSYLKQEEELAL